MDPKQDEFFMSHGLDATCAAVRRYASDAALVVDADGRVVDVVEWDVERGGHPEGVPAEGWIS